MATGGGLTHYFSLRRKKSNLYYMAAATVLCSLFYLIGIWLHGGGATSASVLRSIPCNGGGGGGLSIKDLFPKALDFAAHHTAESLLALSPEARSEHFPPCDPKFSEYTPCQDTNRSLRFEREMLAYRERHCPERGEGLRCRIPAPYGYTEPFRWPESRDVAWYANVPHKHLTVEKAGQNWVQFEGDRFRFPGGGTMFPRGADAYIDDIGNLIDISGGDVRTAIDTGCGVASWGAYLLSRNILPMSFAPKDTHEAQVQFALERGVPALIGVMATDRLPYPSRAFDMAHCSRCLIPWTQYDGIYLIEVDRVLRPGGYWVLSGPPVNWEMHWRGWNRTRESLAAEQEGIERVARSLCWRKIEQKNDIAIWQKATNHMHCKLNRKVFKKPPLCRQDQDPDQAWYTKMSACITPMPEVSDIKETSGGELRKWPERLMAVPPRVSSGSVKGLTAEIFERDTELWRRRVSHYKAVDGRLAERGRFRNVLDMNSGVGGFAAALVDDPVWVMNVVPVQAPVNTLGVVYERGLIGTYHDWCEAMSTYPRTYDFIHADSIFTLYNKRCESLDILLEMDRILRPRGIVIIRDDVDVLANVRSIVERLEWESTMADHEGGPHVREKLLIATKKYWTAPAPDEPGEAGKPAFLGS